MMKIISCTILASIISLSALAQTPKMKVTKDEFKHLTPSTSMVTKTDEGSITIQEEEDRYANGQIKSSGAHTARNKKTGLWYFFREDGSLEKLANYNDGQYNGVYAEYYPNGQLKMHAYHENDVQTGKTLQYFENGVLSQEGSFLNGERHGTMTAYHPNGKVRLQGDFNNGQMTGVHIGYYEDGTKQEEMTYKEGKLHGVVRQYHPNGKLAMEGMMTDGAQTGTWKKYDEEGTMVGSHDF